MAHGDWPERKPRPEADPPAEPPCRMCGVLLTDATRLPTPVWCCRCEELRLAALAVIHGYRWTARFTARIEERPPLVDRTVALNGRGVLCLIRQPDDLGYWDERREATG